MAVAPCPGLLSAFTAPRPVPAATLSTRRAQIAPPPSPFSPNLLTLPPTHRRLRRDPTLPPFSVPENGGASETLDEASSSENGGASETLDEASSSSDSAEKENEAEKPNASYASSVSDAGSAVAEELKEMMRARRKEAEPSSSSSSSSSSDLWGGVSEEIREIEWPAFGKVVGTTSVVLAVIAGSTVALLTVNAVLAEISDRVFAGMGVQDFFG